MQEYTHILISLGTHNFQHQHHRGKQFCSTVRLLSLFHCTQLIPEQAASHGGIKNMCDEDYGISFIGSIQSRYSIESIERNELESEGLNCHLHWVSQVDSLSKA